MDRLCLNQTEFGAVTGIDATYISRMRYPPGKKGRKNVGPEQMARIQAAFDLPPGWFDMDLGALLPGNPYGKPIGTGAKRQWPTDEAGSWPFQLVTFERLDALMQALSARDRAAMLEAMDQQLHAIAYLWENKPRAAPAKRAAR